MNFRYLIGVSALLLASCDSNKEAEVLGPRETMEEQAVFESPSEGAVGKRAVESPGMMIERGDDRSLERARSKPQPSAPVITRDPTPTPTQNLHQDVAPHELTQTSEEKMSTFALDVDIASYTIGRQALNGGFWPSPQSVRVEEWINYFDADIPVEKGETFGAMVEAAPNPLSGEPDTYLMRIALKATTPEKRKPWSLTLLVDTSGSMGPANRLPLAKYAMKQLVDQMRAGDTISLVTYAGSNEVKLASTSDKTKLRQAIDGLVAAGGTAMGSGMVLAYQEALKSQKSDAVNRVIVFSDGDANIGNTTPDKILETIRTKREDGITMMTVGMGNGRYNDAMMERLANEGDGKYVYIDSHREAEKVFGWQAVSWMEDVATDARAQVEFNPETVLAWKQIGYENRQMAHADFRNDAKDAGEVGAGHLVTALYELKVKNTNAKLADIRLRYKKDGVFEERSWTLDGSSVHPKISDASADFQFVAAVAGTAALLRAGRGHRDDQPQLAFGWPLIGELLEPYSSEGRTPAQKARNEFYGMVQKARGVR